MSRRPAGKFRRGAVLVEFAICAVLLLMLLFGILEFGFLFHDRTQLDAAAREGARSLAVGDLPGVAEGRVRSAAVGVPLPASAVTLEESLPDGNGSPTVWTPVGTDQTGLTNDAPSGSFVRATVSYDHPLLSSFALTGGTTRLTGQIVMRRE